MEEPTGSLFVYGPFAQPDILRALLGRVPESEVAVGCGWSARAVDGSTLPSLVRDGGEIVGRLLVGLSDGEMSRLDRQLGGLFERVSLTVAAGSRGPQRSLLYGWPLTAVHPSRPGEGQKGRHVDAESLLRSLARAA